MISYTLAKLKKTSNPWLQYFDFFNWEKRRYEYELDALIESIPDDEIRDKIKAVYFSVFHQRKYEEAKELIANLKRSDESEIGRLTLEGIIALSQGNKGIASERFQKIVNISNTDERLVNSETQHLSCRILTFLYLDIGNYEKVLEYSSLCFASDQKTSLDIFRHGFILCLQSHPCKPSQEGIDLVIEGINLNTEDDRKDLAFNNSYLDQALSVLAIFGQDNKRVKRYLRQQRWPWKYLV